MKEKRLGRKAIFETTVKKKPTYLNILEEVQRKLPQIKTLKTKRK